MNIKQLLFWGSLLLSSQIISAQQKDTLYSFTIGTDVMVSIDQPLKIKKCKTILVFYALPNGNTTAQSMGKLMKAGEDWHFDIQHVRAQTAFIRQQLKNKNIIVAYLENNFKSWPAWKQKHRGFATEIKKIIDTVASLFKKPLIYLNGHSGGGSFIFGYLKAVNEIPSDIHRISFIDSDYGYDSAYSHQFIKWLKNKKHVLTVFAYNDSVALYNGKPVVSATGGTWYRSHLFLKHLSKDFSFTETISDSMIVSKSNNKQIQFFFKTNPDRKIFHTHQVELNGFIHAVLCRTRHDSKNYMYYGPRAYAGFIKE